MTGGSAGEWGYTVAPEDGGGDIMHALAEDSAPRHGDQNADRVDEGQPVRIGVQHDLHRAVRGAVDLSRIPRRHVRPRTANWEPVRANLELFMIGLFPRTERTRLVVQTLMTAGAAGLLLGWLPPALDRHGRAGRARARDHDGARNHVELLGSLCVRPVLHDHRRPHRSTMDVVDRSPDRSTGRVRRDPPAPAWHNRCPAGARSAGAPGDRRGDPQPHPGPEQHRRIPDRRGLHRAARARPVRAHAGAHPVGRPPRRYGGLRHAERHQGSHLDVRHRRARPVRAARPRLRLRASAGCGRLGRIPGLRRSAGCCWSRWPGSGSTRSSSSPSRRLGIARALARRRRTRHPTRGVHRDRRRRVAARTPHRPARHRLGRLGWPPAQPDRRGRDHPARLPDRTAARTRPSVVAARSCA